jgi:hypothetical protein
MIVGLSKCTNHKPNPKGIQGIGNQINACKYITRGRSKSTNHKPNPKGIQGIGNQINACKCVTRERKNIGST